MADFDSAGNWRTVQYVTTGTSEETAYTVPTNMWAYVSQIDMIDDGGGTPTVTLKFTIGGSDRYRLYAKTLDANIGYSLSGSPLVAFDQAVDSGAVKVTTSASGVHFLITLVEGRVKDQ